MSLPNGANIIYVTQYVARLHLHDVASGDLHFLTLRPLDGNVPFPGIGHLTQQLESVATIGAKEGQ